MLILNVFDALTPMDLVFVKLQLQEGFWMVLQQQLHRI